MKRALSIGIVLLAFVGCATSSSGHHPVKVSSLGGVSGLGTGLKPASSAGGGGSGTIHTSAPLSGDGSVGTPATIAAQVDQTLLGNVSGSSAAPSAISVAQVNAAIGIPKWIATARARAKSLSAGTLSPALSTYAEWYNEFADSSGYALTVGAGTAAVSASATIKGGVITLTTGATSGSYGGVTPTGKNPLVINPTTDVVYGYWRVRWNGPADSNTSQRVGFTAAAAPVGGVGASYAFFGFYGTVDNTKFSVEKYDGTTDTITATTTPIELTLFHDVEFYSDGTTGTFYLDGVAQTPTIAMNGIGGHPLTINIANVYTANTTVHTMDVDKAYASFLAQ